MTPPDILSVDRYQFAAQSTATLAARLPAPVVYDIGAGQGPMRAPVEAASLQWRGFDLVPAAPQIRNWNLDVPCPEAQPAAGLVLLLDVIEHLRNPGLALKHIAATLLPHGRLIVSTPNPNWSRSRLHALRTGFLSCFTQEDLDLNGHVFPVWPHILERMLSEVGLVVEVYVTLEGRMQWPGRPITLRYPLRLAHAALNKWIERSDPSASGMSYAMIARKTTGRILP